MVIRIEVRLPSRVPVLASGEFPSVDLHARMLCFQARDAFRPPWNAAALPQLDTGSLKRNEPGN
jgi:hypothetical protein